MRGRKRYLVAGDQVDLVMPHSEVMMHMRVAGKPMRAEMVPAGRASSGMMLMAQLWKDGHRFSFPVLPSEAGIYSDDQGYYAYEESE